MLDRINILIDVKEIEKILQNLLPPGENSIAISNNNSNINFLINILKPLQVSISLRLFSGSFLHTISVYNT
jgi:hypothetical protein